MDKKYIETLLSYPLDAEMILRKSRSLRRYLYENGEERQGVRIAVLGGSTTSELLRLTELFLLERGFEVTFFESAYNRYFEVANYEIELLKEYEPDIVIIHTSIVNVAEWPSFGQEKVDVEKMIEAEIFKFRSIWDSLSQLNCEIIQNNFEMPFRRILGNMECYAESGTVRYVSSLNALFADEASMRPGLYINDINYLSAMVGLSRWYDMRLWHVAKYAMSMEALVEIAFSLRNIILSLRGEAKKGLVLDLDNTCWGGCIGDEGVEGIRLDPETPVGESYVAFQQYAKKLKERGVLLAVCTKNEFATAKTGFSHPDSILRYEDFVSFKANWTQKSKNIEGIAAELNIAKSALVFIDDNPVEREEVRGFCSGVIVPEVGSEVTDYISFIDRNGYFEAVRLTEDDVNRNQAYEENETRLGDLKKYADYDDYLKSLSMELEVSPFEPLYYERIGALVGKTNQFNLTCKRYGISELIAMSEDDHYLTLSGRLSDKYGQNGVVSLVIVEQEGTVGHIRLWLMSCRVFNRCIEYAMFDELVMRALGMGVEKLVGYYNKGKSNDLVENLYGRLGFVYVQSGDGNAVWDMEISADYNNYNKIITITDE